MRSQHSRWEPRSLKDFGVASVEDLARDYDLVVIDHPHIGLIAETGCAVPLDEMAAPGDLAALGACSHGRSHQSYHYGGRQWALAVDAACQSAPAARICSRSRRSAGTRCWS
jgi:multiple sugar transport system substrate-binding protein